MNYTCFDVSIENHIAHIILNRPEKRNSMTRLFWDELPAIVREIDASAEARVIVISSTGPHFCSGLDLTEFMSNTGDESALDESGVPVFIIRLN